VVWCGLLLFYAVSGITLVSAAPIGVTAPKPASSAEAAYRRGDLFERRKLMMEEWAKFVRPAPSAKIVSIGDRRRGDSGIDSNRRG
jgi:hypothetical protein